MRIEAALAGLVVIRRHDQDGVRPGPLGMLGELDRLAGVVGAGAGNHRHSPPGRLDANFDDSLVLVMRQRRRLARRAHRHQAGRAFTNLPVDEGAKGLFIEGAVAHGRDQRGYGAPEHFGLGRSESRLARTIVTRPERGKRNAGLGVGGSAPSPNQSLIPSSRFRWWDLLNPVPDRAAG